MRRAKTSRSQWLFSMTDDTLLVVAPDIIELIGTPLTVPFRMSSRLSALNNLKVVLKRFRAQYLSFVRLVLANSGVPMTVGLGINQSYRFMTY